MKKKLILLGMLLAITVLIFPQMKASACNVGDVKFSTKITKIKTLIKQHKNKVFSSNYVAKTVKVGPFGSEYNIISKQQFLQNYLKAYHFKPIYAETWTVEKWNSYFWGIQDAKKTQNRGLIVARMLDKNTDEVIKTYGENTVFMFLVVKKNNKVRVIAGLDSTEGILKDYFKMLD